MRFGERIRELRQANNLTQRQLAEKVGVEFSYISKIENEKLDFGDVPSERLVQKLAEALEADEFLLLVLAEKVPPRVKRRLFERPEVFRVLVGLDDNTLDALMATVDRLPTTDNASF
jgi:HTH-type transcriptional regulator, competence development regulator